MLFAASCAIAAPLALVALLWACRFLHFYRHLKRIPSPAPLWPILGNAPTFSGGPTEMLPLTCGLLRKTRAKSIRLTIGFKCLVLTMDHGLVKAVLASTDHVHKSDGYRFLKTWLGEGLLIAEGERWRKHRKMLTPTFHFQILEHFAGIFESTGNVLVEKLRAEVGNAATDIYPHFTLCALDTICETAMGTSVNAQRNSENEYVKCVKAMCKLIQQRSFNPFFQSEFIYRRSKLYQEEVRALEVLHSFTRSVIKAKREEIARGQSGNPGREPSDGGIKRRTALLDLLINCEVDGKPMSDDVINEEVSTFMFAGHDTSATAMCYVMHELARNPQVQEKVYQEQKDVFGDDLHGPASFKAINEMRYLEMVVKETLRLYPSVPLFLRKLREGLDHDGIHIPKGTTVGIYAYGIHRDERHHANPDLFDPERFSPESNDNIKAHPYSYVPFSAGPRNCIGQRFAMLEMKATLSKVLRSFRVLPVSPPHVPRLSAETVLISTNGILVKLETRP